MLKALIFDVDGTLADTERDGHRVAFNRAFQEAGLDWDWSVELYGELLQVTGGKERIQLYVNQFLKNFDPPKPLTEFAADLHKAKTAHYLQLLETGQIPLRPGVKRLLADAREEGIRLAIATTTTEENVTTLLKVQLGEESVGWFEVIAAGDVVPAKKPAPDIYFYALEQLGLKPQECIAFEDSENGIKSSSGAGLETIITTNDYTRDHDFDGAVLVVDHMGEPNEPFNVIEGDALGHTMIDLNLVREITKRIHG